MRLTTLARKINKTPKIFQLSAVGSRPDQSSKGVPPALACQSPLPGKLSTYLLIFGSSGTNVAVLLWAAELPTGGVEGGVPEFVIGNDILVIKEGDLYSRSEVSRNEKFSAEFIEGLRSLLSIARASGS